MQTHPHAFGKKGVGATPNSRVCVLCKPEKEIWQSDHLKATQFTQLLNAGVLQDSDDTMITHLLSSEYRFRHKFTQNQVEFLERNVNKSIKPRIRKQIEKRIKRLTPRDGTQSPFRTHATDPMFHTMALCCRGCLKDWHQVLPQAVLSETQMDKFTTLSMRYIRKFILNRRRSDSGRKTVRGFMTREYSTTDTPRYDHSDVDIFEESGTFIVKKVGPGVTVALPLKRKNEAKHPKRKRKKQEAA